jgi:phosphodiesterase/alkaline phosphatase D-like protein
VCSTERIKISTSITTRPNIIAHYHMAIIKAEKKKKVKIRRKKQQLSTNQKVYYRSIKKNVSIFLSHYITPLSLPSKT